MRAVVVAFGTRGDVQPHVVLARELAAQSKQGELMIVTHAEHSAWAEQLLDSTARLATVRTPAVLSTAHDEAARAAVALQQAVICLAAARSAEVIVFNLFALEGFLVAELLQLPCLVVQPYLIPTPMPAAISGYIRRARPALYTHLHQPLAATAAATAAAAATTTAAPPAAAENGSSTVQWSDVEHWMWPLLTPHWTAVREQLAAAAGLPLPAADAMWTQRRAPAVFYALSPQLVDRTPDWPASAVACGAIYPQPAVEAAAAEQHSTEHNRIQQWLSQCEDKPVYIGLGSAAQCTTSDVHIPSVLAALVQGAVSAGARVLLCCDTATAAAVDKLLLLQPCDESQLYVLTAAVQHAWLLTKCLLAVHHGGSGTVAAVARAGLPHVICPMFFDQVSYIHASRVEQVLLSYTSSSRRLLWLVPLLVNTC
jgi:UDP:flavonoid glycosyltransferase YjiC (YdhE family)